MGLLRSLFLVTLLFLPLLRVQRTESAQPPFSCDSSNPSTKSYPFSQTSLPITKTCRDLVSRFTLDEKISQLAVSAALIPQFILTPASFDTHLLYRFGQVTLQDLADTYQPPFQSCVQEGRGTSGLMCAYNRVNGVPSCADYNLLSQTARGQWGFKGYITSDCDAVAIIPASGYSKSPEDAVADVLKAGPPCKFVTPVQSLQSYVENVIDRPGYSMDEVACYSADIDKAVDAAVDYVVLVMGLDQTQEREAHDRVTLELPQQQLITSVARVAKKPVVLVLLSGGPVDISSAKHGQNIGSMLWAAGYPGEDGGTAIAEIIFGDHNPGGSFPVTWYPQHFTKVPMTDMRMSPEPSSGYPGRIYRFYKGEKVYEFGYGLCYSNYYSYEFSSVTQSMLQMNQPSATQMAEYKSISELGEKLCESKKFPVTVGLKNQGEMAGKHPILLFVKQLVGFQRINLHAEERAEVEFVLNPCKHLASCQSH